MADIHIYVYIHICMRMCKYDRIHAVNVVVTVVLGLTAPGLGVVVC